MNYKIAYKNTTSTNHIHVISLEVSTSWGRLSKGCAYYIDRTDPQKGIYLFSDNGSKIFPEFWGVVDSSVALGTYTDLSVEWVKNEASAALNNDLKCFTSLRVNPRFNIDIRSNGLMVHLDDESRGHCWIIDNTELDNLITGLDFFRLSEKTVFSSTASEETMDALRAEGLADFYFELSGIVNGNDGDSRVPLVIFRSFQAAKSALISLS